ncbi:hypothetical protein JXQ70_08615 [bacterium]|nr:hypothetical protein [bacterium]
MTSKRIQFIRNVVGNLNAIKSRGIDLNCDYSTDELIYDTDLKRFGRITEANRYYFTVMYEDTQITYFRKQGWKPCKEKFLQDHFMTMTNRDLALVLQCTEKIVEKKLCRMHLKRNFEWDASKDTFLIRNIDKTNQWLAAKLKTTVSSIKGRIYRLKTKGVLPATHKKTIRVWLEEDDQYIRDHLDKSNQWLADHFDVKVSSIKSRIRKLRENGSISERRKRGKKKAAS